MPNTNARHNEEAGAEAPKNGEDSESDRRGDRFGCFDRNLPHLLRVSLRAEGGNQTRPTPLHLVLRNKPKKQGNNNDNQSRKSRLLLPSRLP